MNASGRPVENTLSRDTVAHFHAFGFAVLQGAFDPAPLSAEIDEAMKQTFRAPFRANVGGTELTGRYVPMMCDRTPVSLSLLDNLSHVGAALLDGPVLPVRAKSVLYFAATAWHRDSVRDVPSVGFAAYLEPLRADTGALRVLPGSHRVPISARRRRPTSPTGWPREAPPIPRRGCLRFRASPSKPTRAT
jgi:hypothetical protein